MKTLNRLLVVTLCCVALTSVTRAETQLIPGRLVAVKAVMAPEKMVPQRGYLVTGTVDQGVQMRAGEALMGGIAWLNGSTSLRPLDRISILMATFESADALCAVLKKVLVISDCEISEVDNFGAKKTTALVELSPRHKRMLRNEGITLNSYPESTLVNVSSGDYLGLNVIVAAPTPLGIILANGKGEYQVLPVDKSPGVSLFKRGS